MMKLRPHHLLCIQKFTGHGYDAAFTAHMTSVVAALAENPQTQITLTHGCDELCEKCPNKIDGRCSSLQKVETMDSLVLDVCGLADEDTVSWTEAARQARERVFATDEFQRICAHCEWYALCQNTEVSYESYEHEKTV